MGPSDALRFALSDRVDGVEVRPAGVPLALLGQFQADVQEFLKGSGREVDTNQVIVSVEEGSLAIVASGLLAATGLWADMARLQTPSALGLVDPRRAAVIDRWQAAARNHPHRSYLVADRDQRVSVRVDAGSNFHDQVEAVWVPVEKHLYGTVVDWGGATRANVHLKLESGRVAIISASQQLLASEERNRLYRPALLRVSAEENLRTAELRNLVLLAFEPHQPEWDEAKFAALVAKGTEAWADVPEGWLETLRGRQG